MHKTDLSSLINNLVTSFKEWGGNLEYDLNPNIGEIHLEENILHSILFNLANNGFNNQEVPRNERKVNLTVIPCELPKEAVYVSEGASDYSQFVGFHFQNTGREFPKDKPLIERLTICPSEMKGGFGLYFTGLATKVLRGCVDIKSEGEDTTVSFYQPIYPDEQARGGNKT